MKYIINNELIYESDSRMLWHILLPEEHILISETAGRLLVRFLDTPNTVIDRAGIIHDVWDKFGYVGSGNSLTQYVSILRKVFSSMGVDDIIQTIPKLGFSLNANVIQEESLPAAIFSNDDEFLKMPESIGQKVLSSKKISFKAILFIGLPFCLTVVFLIRMCYFLYSSPNLFTDAKFFKLGNIDSCPVYTLYPYSVEYQSRQLKIANQLSTTNLKCINNSFFIFDPEDLYIFESQGRVFLTRCTYKKESTTEISGCNDVYIHN